MKDRDLPPPGKADEIDLVKFVKERAYRSSPLYADDFLMARKAELYDQGEQWLQRAHSSRDSRSPTQWIGITSNANDPNSIPLPVYNEMVALRENESARLGRPEYKPRVKPKGENPGITEKEGADGAERALISRLKAMRWDEEQEQLVYNMPMYGGSWLHSYWDQTWMDTVRVPEKQAMCQNHELMRQPEAPPEPPPMPPPQDELGIGGAPGGSPLQEGLGLDAPLEQPAVPGPEDPFADPLAGPPEAALGGMGPTGPADGGVGGGAISPPASPPPMPPLPPFPEMGMEAQPECDFTTPVDKAPQDKICPDCGGSLEEYNPTQEEAQGDLGKDWPKGDWNLRALKGPYGVFPRDAGVGVDRTDVDEWIYAHVERLDWVAERYPDKVRDENGDLKIHPEHPTTLMSEHPTMGAPLVFQQAQHTSVFKDHVLVYEYNRKPWLYWDQEEKAYTKNHGRHTVIVGDRVCIDTDLEIESLNKPGTWVARARMEFIPWEPKEGGRRQTAGMGLWDRLFDAQDGINERMSQIRAVNQRGALPYYLQARGRNFETKAANSSVPFRHVQVDIDPTDRQPPLQLIQNTTIDSGVYAEIEAGQQFAQRVSGQVEVERGQVPPGVAAATAIAYLKTESGEKRRPRIRRIRGGLVRGWEHGLQLMSALYIEDREYSFEDEFGEERDAFIHGEIIAAANPKVDIYPTPDYDQADAQRESIRDMVQLGILKPDQTPQVNRKIVEALDPTLKFFVEDDLQEDQAHREWRDFKEKGKVPVIDPSLDDPMTHYQLHGQSCFSAWFRGLEEQGGWDQVLSILGADWDQQLLQIAMARQPGTSIQTEILRFWQERLGQAIQMGMLQPQDPKALQQILQWRSHMESHKLRALIQSSGIEAPATGSSPDSASEEPGGEGGVGPPPGAGMVQ